MLSKHDVVILPYWHGSRQRERPYAIIEPPKIDGDELIIIVHPTNYQFANGRVKHKRFPLNDLPQVVGTDSTIKTKWRAVTDCVLGMLPHGTPPLNTVQILDEIKEQIGYIFRHNCNLSYYLEPLVKNGVLVKKRRSNYERYLNHYRRPLLEKSGLFVVEFEGMKSERLGWIEGCRTNKQTGLKYPVCRWVDGTFSMSSEYALEPVTLPSMRQTIRDAQLRLRNEPPPIVISPWLLSELKVPDTSHYPFNKKALLEVAKLLKYINPDALGWQGKTQEAWSRTISYLNIYYPGWKGVKRNAAS